MELAILKNIGLTDGEIKIYEVLLEGGELSANEIIKRSGLKKGDCYNKIYDLSRRNFIEQLTKDKKKHFRLAHPNAIKDYIDNKMKEMSTTEREIDALLPSILSNYNLSYRKPGVKIFEGEESNEKILIDQLSSTEEIYSIVDPESIDKFLDQKINKKYAEERIKRKIVKKILVEDSPYNRERYSNQTNEFTLVRFISGKMPRFATSMLVYDNKLAFQTWDPSLMIGIIIQDKLIYSMQRALFEYIWAQATD